MMENLKEFDIFRERSDTSSSEEFDRLLGLLSLAKFNGFRVSPMAFLIFET